MLVRYVQNWHCVKCDDMPFECFIQAVRSTHHLEVPLAFNGRLLVSEEVRGFMTQSDCHSHGGPGMGAWE